MPGPPSDEQTAEIIGAASGHEQVRVVLGTRYAYISTDVLSFGKVRTRDCSEQPRTRVLVYSYTNKIAVEVIMLGAKVQ